MKKTEHDISKPFKFAESCMFQYLRNTARIESLRDDLKMVDMQSSIKSPIYDEYHPTVGYIDNIPVRIMKIDMLEGMIAGLERWTKPITRLLNDLDSPYNISPERQDLGGILRIRYIYGNTWEKSLEYLKMPKVRFLERRRQLVEMAIGYMGLKT